MVRVTIEMVPHGVEERKYHLGTMEIANDGTGTLTRGNYKVYLSRRGRPGWEWRSGRFEGFPRKALGVYDLIFRALRACGVAERNPVVGASPAGQREDES